jgi:hypothetical protein
MLHEPDIIAIHTLLRSHLQSDCGPHPAGYPAIARAISHNLDAIPPGGGVNRFD